MRKARIGVLAGLAALIVAVLPAAAGGNDWGTWTFHGSDTHWSGTVVDAHRITGVLMGLQSRVMFNSVKSFTLGGKKCKTSSSAGTGYCYYLKIPANKKLRWKLTTKTPVKGADKLAPCIEYRGAWHCRYSDPTSP